MLYLIRLDLRQPDGMSRSKFQELWRRGIATEPRPGGSGIFRSFKVVGQCTIFAVAEFPDNQALDEALIGLPIFEDLGSAVEIEVYPVWPFEDLDAPEEALDEPAEEPELPKEADLISGATDDPGGAAREEAATVEDLPDPDAWGHATPPALPEENSSTGTINGSDVLEEEQAEPERDEQEEERPGADLEPGQPEEAGQVTEAIQALETQVRAPAGSERDETEDPPAADSTARPESYREREKPPVFVSARRQDAARHRDANELIEESGGRAEDPDASGPGKAGGAREEPEQPGGGHEEPAQPDEGSITGAIRGLDAPSQGRAQGRVPAEEEAASAERERPDETGQEPTQIDKEGSVTGMIRSLDAGGSGQPAEGQVTGMIRSLDSTGESSAARVLLRIIAGPASGQTFEVGRAGATMGRSPDNLVRMSDERLSRRHARIEFKDGGYWLADLGSSNGTYVNQHRLSAPHRLRSGDMIGLGRTRLSVELETAG